MDFLSEEQLLIWKLDKPVDSFIGGELKLFSKNASKIASWASENDLMSGTNPEWTNFAAAFKLWEEIHAFITRAEVKKDDDFELEIKNFEVDVNNSTDMVDKFFLHLDLVKVEAWKRCTHIC